MKTKVWSVTHVFSRINNVLEGNTNYSTVAVTANGRTIKGTCLNEILAWLPAHEFDVEFIFPEKKVSFEFQCDNPDLEMEEAYWAQFQIDNA